MTDDELREAMREMGKRGGSAKTSKTSKRGFASMSKAKRKRIAKMGGKAPKKPRASS